MVIDEILVNGFSVDSVDNTMVDEINFAQPDGTFVSATSNLLDFTTPKITTNSAMTVTRNNNELTFSGTLARYQVYIDFQQLFLEDGKTYTVSCSKYYIYGQVAVRVQLEVRAKPDSGETNKSYEGWSGAYKFTVDNSKFTYHIRIQAGSTAGEFNETLRFWLNEGDTALEYEPYEPIPYIKQDTFHFASATNEIAVGAVECNDSVDEPIKGLTIKGTTSFGQNYFVFEPFTYTKRGVTVTWDGELLTLNGTVEDGSGDFVKQLNSGEMTEIPVDNINLTFEPIANANPDSTYISIKLYAENKNYGTSQDLVGYLANKPRFYSNTLTCHYPGMIIIVLGSGGKVFNNEKFRIRIEAQDAVPLQPTPQNAYLNIAPFTLENWGVNMQWDGEYLSINGTFDTKGVFQRWIGYNEARKIRKGKIKIISEYVSGELSAPVPLYFGWYAVQDGSTVLNNDIGLATSNREKISLLVTDANIGNFFINSTVGMSFTNYKCKLRLKYENDVVLESENYFNAGKTTTTQRGVTIDWDGEYFTVNGTAESAGNVSRFINRADRNIVPLSTARLTAQAVGGYASATSTLYVGIYPEGEASNPSRTPSVTVSRAGTYNVATITTNNEYIGNLAFNVAAGAVFVDFRVRIRVEQYERQTVTIPTNIDNLELALLGTGGANDSVEVDTLSNKVTYTQRTRWLEFDGSEKWQLINSKFLILNNKPSASTSIRGHCNKYTWNTYADADISFGCNVSNISVKDSTYNGDVQAFKDWLASEKANGTPMKAMYALSTPIETDITNTELGKQLLALQAYDKYTRVRVDSAVSVPIDVNYWKQIKP